MSKLSKKEKAGSLPHLSQQAMSRLTLVPRGDFKSEDYPNLDAINQSHLHIAQRYAQKAHDATRLEEEDEDFPKDGLRLREEYMAILNYSASRVYANSAAMMMPITYDQWSGVQFSDDTRMILHGVMHRHYKVMWMNDPYMHATRPELLKWCRHLGITTTEKTLRKIINDGIADMMLQEIHVGRGEIKGIAPTVKAVDMYQGSCCLYAALIGGPWLDKNLAVLDDVPGINLQTLFADIVVITQGMIREAALAGIDLVPLTKPLPRFTTC